MSTNLYRVDKVPKTQTTVPCGMNTIIYLGKNPSSRIYVEHKLPRLKEDEYFLFSRWDSNKQDYIVYHSGKKALRTIDTEPPVNL